MVAGGDPEGSQTDSDDGSAYHPDFRKETVGEEADESGSNCSTEFLNISLVDHDLEKQPPVIYTNDNSSDIFPVFFPKNRKDKLKSRSGRGKKEHNRYHIASQENPNHEEDTDDDYILGGYTKPIQSEPLILKRSREDIRAEFVSSDDSELDEDTGGYTRNKLDQPIIISQDDDAGCKSLSSNVSDYSKTDEVTAERTVGQLEETDPLIEDDDYTTKEEHSIPQTDAANEGGTLHGSPKWDGSIDNIDDCYLIQSQQESKMKVDDLEWDSSDDDNDGYTVGKSIVEPIIIKPPWDVDDGLEWDSSDNEDTGPRYTKQKYNGFTYSFEMFEGCSTTNSYSDKVSDFDDITVHSNGTKIRIGRRTGIGIGQLSSLAGSEKGVYEVKQKFNTISEEMKSTELETGPNKLLLYDPSQNFPRIEEVRVVQAPPPQSNGPQDASENGECNAESLKDLPDEEEQRCEVGSSATVDERYDSGDAAQERSTDGDTVERAEVDGGVADRHQQSGVGAAAGDERGIEHHDDAAQHNPGENTRQSTDTGVVNDSGYGSAGSIESYQRVTFSFRRAIVMLLGYNNAGKTCLADTLLGLPFRDQKKVETHDNHSDQLDDLSSCKVTDLHALATDQHWTQLDESFGEALTKDLETRLTEVVPTGGNRYADQELMGLKILDMDGEFPFYQTHPMLMSKSMVFLVAMDVTKKLDDDLPESTLAKKWKGKIEYPNTPRKFLDHWLTSTSTFLNEYAYPDQHGSTKSIVLVLTHTDKLDPRTRREEIKKFEQEVRAHVKKKHAAKYIEKTIIAVSNTDRDICRDELKTLKDTVLRLAELKHATFGVSKSCTWLKFETDIVKHCEVLDRNYLTIREMVHMSGRVGMSREQLKEFLTLHKELGSLYYSDDESDDSLVVTGPQFLVDAYTAIIDVWIYRRTSQWSLTEQETLETDLDDGIFSLQSLSLIWKNLDETFVENLALILKASRLFISWKQKDEQGNILPEKYIVPCFQPPSREPEDGMQETLGPRTLVYFFHSAKEKRMILSSGFLPRGFMFLIIASLMEEKENRGTWEKTQLCCNGATFRTGSHGDVDLTMSTDASIIKLNVSTNQHLQSDNLCAEISTARNTFEDEVKELLQNRFPGLLCSVCVSPCHTSNQICQADYSCLNILGTLGQVGTKQPWSARCKTHRKEAAVDTFRDWFYNELNQLANENSAAKSDESVINNVTQHIPNIGTLKDIAIRLKIRGRDVDQIISDCPNDIKAASLKVLYDRWCENTEGSLQRGSAKYEQLKRAFNEAGVHNVLQ